MKPLLYAFDGSFRDLERRASSIESSIGELNIVCGQILAELKHLRDDLSAGQDDLRRRLRVVERAKTGE